MYPFQRPTNPNFSYATASQFSSAPKMYWPPIQTSPMYPYQLAPCPAFPQVQAAQFNPISTIAMPHVPTFPQFSMPPTVAPQYQTYSNPIPNGFQVAQSMQRNQSYVWHPSQQQDLSGYSKTAHFTPEHYSTLAHPYNTITPTSDQSTENTINNQNQVLQPIEKGENGRYSAKTTKAFIDWYNKHCHLKKIKRVERQELIEATGVSDKDLKSWMRNYRTKLKSVARKREFLKVYYATASPGSIKTPEEVAKITGQSLREVNTFLESQAAKASVNFRDPSTSRTSETNVNELDDIITIDPNQPTNPANQLEEEGQGEQQDQLENQLTSEEANGLTNMSDEQLTNFIADDFLKMFDFDEEDVDE